MVCNLTEDSSIFWDTGRVVAGVFSKDATFSAVRVFLDGPLRNRLIKSSLLVGNGGGATAALRLRALSILVKADRTSKSSASRGVCCCINSAKFFCLREDEGGWFVGWLWLAAGATTRLLLASPLVLLLLVVAGCFPVGTTVRSAAIRRVSAWDAVLVAEADTSGLVLAAAAARRARRFLLRVALMVE